MFFETYIYYIPFLLLAVSIAFKFINKDAAAVAMLLLTAFVVRMVMAHSDPFLHDWDERFHALVARNMMDDPFNPVLRKEKVLPVDMTMWCCNSVWLHKQPLFMWQMALSMKVFGVSEFAIRYPSVLMGTAMVFLTYRVALLLTDNKNTAYLSALLFCFSSFHLMLVAGHGMDHNDVAFAFYVMLSIWAYVMYVKTGTIKWVILIGVFTGCAVLNKWLTGILVYAAWGLNILLHIKRKER